MLMFVGAAATSFVRWLTARYADRPWWPSVIAVVEKPKVNRTIRRIRERPMRERPIRQRHTREKPIPRDTHGPHNPHAFTDGLADLCRLFPLGESTPIRPFRRVVRPSELPDDLATARDITTEADHAQGVRRIILGGRELVTAPCPDCRARGWNDVRYRGPVTCETCEGTGWATFAY